MAKTWNELEGESREKGRKAQELNEYLKQLEKQFPNRQSMVTYLETGDSQGLEITLPVHHNEMMKLAHHISGGLAVHQIILLRGTECIAC